MLELIHSYRYSIAYAIVIGVPRERQRRPSRAETQRQLIDAAARVVARRGVNAATVEAITEEAGLSSGALYSNFSGKEALILHLYEERVRQRAREIGDSLDLAGGDARRPAASVAEVLRRDRDWFLLYFEFVLYAARTPRFARRFALAREEALDELATGVAAAVERAGRSLAIDRQVLARSLSAMVYGLALDRLIAKSRVTDDLVVASIRALIRGSVSRERDDARERDAGAPR